MSFRDFKFPAALEQLGLTHLTQPLLEGVKPVDIGSTLRNTLSTYGQLALDINTEKARSEWLIAPVIGELWARGRSQQIYVLSGVDFTVDQEEGLTGVVDFLIGRGPQSFYVSACPILAVVEAKNESIAGGQGQCAAEMVAAQRFNRKTKSPIDTIYGGVTTATTGASCG